MRLRIAIAGATLVMAVAGCAGDDEGGDPTRDTVERATAPDDPIAAEPSSNDLPAGFPERLIPVLVGQVEQGLRVAEGQTEAWTVLTLHPAEAPREAMSDAVQRLGDAGFASEVAAEATGYSVAVMSDEELRVSLTAADGAGGTELGYTVERI